VAFSRLTVKEEATRFAQLGYSLIDERGMHWLWNKCYNALVDTESRNLIVISLSQTGALKRSGLDNNSAVSKRRWHNPLTGSRELRWANETQGREG